jgi:nitroreductase
MDIKRIKIAPTNYNVLDLIKNRFSARAFSDKALALSEVNTLLEAAMWAPSAMNEQPWRYYVALKSNVLAFQKLVDLLVQGNMPWAKNAGALILCTVKLTFKQNQQPNVSALHDVGMANQNLLLQALSMGIYGHVMGGFHRNQAKEIFNMGSDYEPVCIIALGYLGDLETLVEPFKERERTQRTRKLLNEVVTYL